jgi:hydrogenase maturation protein HypF
MRRVGLRVTGIVQGVGFRPFIYRLAKKQDIAGWVLNDDKGVYIEAEGQEKAIGDFIAGIRTEAPAMAVVENVIVQELMLRGETSFAIHQSPTAKMRNALVSPDIAICDDCKKEVLDETDRRFGYAFTNCTNCGPRYSIIKDVPYDRPKTTMGAFTMCVDCQKEYDDPLNRRFHAQPNACADCGPGYRLLDRTGNAIKGEPLKRVHAFIMQGCIAAVKGIGGYHLACDAKNEKAVAVLRKRKFREDKPFAVMCGSMMAAKSICEISADEEKLLRSPIAPIVLLRKKTSCDEILAAEVAPGNPCLGIMLPYAPVHYLLLAKEDIWVMTSANRSEEPIAFRDGDAQERLGAIADVFLVHNREIHSRVDDSVMRMVQGAPYLMRRSRGMAPAPIRLAEKSISVLACGAEMKNTFCLTKGSAAFVSEHIGDLANQVTFRSYTGIIEHYKHLFEIVPRLLACDMHPEYLSTKYAHELSSDVLPLIEVQHHHAHIASVLAEHGEMDKVIGVAFDGTGYGDDACIWGGEFLLADCKSYERFGHFCYLPLPGGEKAAKEPWRQALWVLYLLYGDDLAKYQPEFVSTLPPNWQLLVQATKSGLNAPLSSSAGRLFDTAGSLLGIRNVNHYEGQSAIELERLANGAVGDVLPYKITAESEIDFLPVFRVLVENQTKQTRAELAMSFHETMAAAIVDMVQRMSRATGIRKVALSGGVFQNKTLLDRVAARLPDEYSMLLNRKVPPNDGGLSLGQAAVAIANMKIVDENKFADCKETGRF